MQYFTVINILGHLGSLNIILSTHNDTLSHCQQDVFLSCSLGFHSNLTSSERLSPQWGESVTDPIPLSYYIPYTFFTELVMICNYLVYVYLYSGVEVPEEQGLLSFLLVYTQDIRQQLNKDLQNDVRKKGRKGKKSNLFRIMVGDEC